MHSINNRRYIIFICIEMSETTKRNSELVDVSYEIRNQVKLVPGEKTDGGSKMFDLYLKEPYYVSRLSFIDSLNNSSCTV